MSKKTITLIVSPSTRRFSYSDFKLLEEKLNEGWVIIHSIAVSTSISNSKNVNGQESGDIIYHLQKP